MKTSDKGIEFIKGWEGCRLDVYKDIGGLTTVGYGHRTDKPVGDRISQGLAEQLLREDLENFEHGVSQLVLIEINQNQFDALVSFSYNTGLAALKRSSLLKLVNSGDFKGAADKFLLWCNAGGKPSAGLLRRRQAERALFLA